MFSPEPGHEIRGASTLHQESPYYSAKEGDRVEVQYLPSDPAINAINDSTASGAPPLAFFLFMPIFILLMFSPMFVPQIREVLRARQLYMKGSLALGTVVYVKKSATSFWPGWPGNSTVEVFVEFELPTKVKHEAVARCQNDWLVNHLAPDTKVHVAYMGEKPSKVTLLEAYLR